jgi:hypothetical protein
MQPLPRLARIHSNPWLLGAWLCLVAAMPAAAMFADGFETQLKAPPSGLFHSAGPTQDGAPPVLDAAASTSSLVHGVLVRVAWSTLHPGPGQFDFSLLDREFERAVSAGKQISLGVIDSWSQPQWLQQSCTTFSFSFRGEPKLACLPWDATYQARKAELLQALGARYDSHPNLAQVYFSYAAMTNGIEMHWRVDEAAFGAAGYTAQRLASSYTEIFDQYVAAFPRTPISIEVHMVFDSSALAEAAYAHCRLRLGSRCGVAIWWCAERMTRPPGGESGVWAIAQDAARNSFLTCQTIGNFSTQPERFDEGAGWTPLQALQSEMDFMLQSGVRHWELWSVDIVNPEFQTDLLYYRDLLQP